MSTTTFARPTLRPNPTATLEQETPGSAFDQVHFSEDLDMPLTPSAEQKLAQTVSTASPNRELESNPTPTAPEKSNMDKVLDVGASVGKYLGGWGVLGSSICEFFKGEDRGVGLSRGAGTLAGGAFGLTVGSVVGSGLLTGASYLALKLGISAAVAATPVGLLGIAAGVGAWVLGGYMAGKGADLFQRWFGGKEPQQEVTTTSLV